MNTAVRVMQSEEQKCIWSGTGEMLILRAGDRAYLRADVIFCDCWKAEEASVRPDPALVILFAIYVHSANALRFITNTHMALVKICPNVTQYSGKFTCSASELALKFNFLGLCSIVSALI